MPTNLMWQTVLAAVIYSLVIHTFLSGIFGHMTKFENFLSFQNNLKSLLQLQMQF